MEYGTTLSPRHLRWIDLTLEEGLEGLKELNIKLLRIACYWEEVEKSPGRFDFNEVDQIIHFCEKEKIKVLMVVGMKAPRWPEYYIPQWVLKSTTPVRRLSKINTTQTELLKATLAFVKEAVNHYKSSTAIKAWQVENEPLDPSGLMRIAISPGFLTEEIKLVRKLDKKCPIAINLWGNELSLRGLYKEAQQLADIVGLDLYLRNPIPYLKFLHKYVGPLDSQEKIRSIIKSIKKNKKEVWITELQAEPWEPNNWYKTKKYPPSFRPNQFQKNLEYAKDLGADKIFFWGYEYWLLQKQKGVPDYWQEAKKILL